MIYLLVGSALAALAVFCALDGDHIWSAVLTGFAIANLGFALDDALRH